jgi:hypothetical protein
MVLGDKTLDGSSQFLLTLVFNDTTGRKPLNAIINFSVHCMQQHALNTTIAHVVLQTLPYICSSAVNSSTYVVLQTFVHM